MARHGDGAGFRGDWEGMIIGAIVIGAVIIVILAFTFLFLGSIIPAIPLSTGYANIVANAVGFYTSAINLFLNPIFDIVFALALLVLIAVAIYYLLALKRMAAR